jgi:hypothetical protein
MNAPASQRPERVVTVGTDPTSVRRDRDHVGSRGLAASRRVTRPGSTAAVTVRDGAPAYAQSQRVRARAQYWLR